jgi:hypothetical protein
MTNHLRKLVPAAVAFLTIFCPAAKANLLTNGGFALTNNSYSENAAPEGWTNIGPADGVIADSVFGTPSYNGFLYYFDTGGYGDSGPASGDGIEQTVATSIGTQYTLSLGVSNENYSGWGPEFLTILVNGTSIGSYAMAYNSSYGGFELPWVTDVLDFTASSSSSTIAFTVTGADLGGQDPLIAGIDLEVANANGNSPVPEPATISFFGLGLAALPFARRSLSRLRS